MEDEFLTWKYLVTHSYTELTEVAAQFGGISSYNSMKVEEAFRKSWEETLKGFNNEGIQRKRLHDIYKELIEHQLKVSLEPIKEPEPKNSSKEPPLLDYYDPEDIDTLLYVEILGLAEDPNFSWMNYDLHAFADSMEAEFIQFWGKEKGMAEEVFQGVLKQIACMHWTKCHGFTDPDAYFMKLIEVGVDISNTLEPEQAKRFLEIQNNPLIFDQLKEKYKPTARPKISNFPKPEKKYGLIKWEDMDKVLLLIIADISGSPHFEGFPCPFETVKDEYLKFAKMGPPRDGVMYDNIVTFLTQIIITKWAQWRGFKGDEHYEAFAMKAKQLDYDLGPVGPPNLLFHIENMKRNPEAFKAAHAKFTK